MFWKARPLIMILLLSASIQTIRLQLLRHGCLHVQVVSKVLIGVNADIKYVYFNYDMMKQ